MKWHEIPKIRLEELYDEQNNVRGVFIKAKDFEKLVEKMEDFLDIRAIERAKRTPGRTYSHQEIQALIASKKQ